MTMDGVVQSVAAASAPAVMDGVSSTGTGESPDSSIGPSRVQKKPLPILRQSGSTTGYERPERARTSHACEPCRDRKTKCDGERPSCRRCLHNGMTCHYGYGKGWKKRKTAEDLTITSQKLARYEELLNDIYPLVSDSVREMINTARAQTYLPTGGNESGDAGTPSSSHMLDGELQGSGSSTSLLQLPSLSQTAKAVTFAAPPHPIPRPLASESYSSSTLSPSVASSSRSPTADDFGGSPAIRLPSITRHGFLLEESASNLSQQPGVGVSLSETAAHHRLQALERGEPSGSTCGVLEPLSKT